MTKPIRDHGGGLDAAIAEYGGNREGWIDLSTGINPTSYPIPQISPNAWRALPDRGAHDRLVQAARAFWDVPSGAAVLPAPGASSLIAQIPALMPAGKVSIQTPTYNEHAAAFENAGWQFDDMDPNAFVTVHPNNPDGRLVDKLPKVGLCVIDESFCDVMPVNSLIAKSAEPGTIVLKSFGKFWGLAGLRLGFAIGDPEMVQRLADMLGPWPVSGPALQIGADALEDLDWAVDTRAQLQRDADRLDNAMSAAGAKTIGGTSLFRLYDVGDADHWHVALAQRHILTRVFPYSTSWLRLGLPGPHDWDRVLDAIGSIKA